MSSEHQFQAAPLSSNASFTAVSTLLKNLDDSRAFTNEGEQLIEDVILRFKRLHGNLDVPDEKAVTLLWKLFQKEPLDFYVRHVESDATLESCDARLAALAKRYGGRVRQSIAEVAFEDLTLEKLRAEYPDLSDRQLVHKAYSRLATLQRQHEPEMGSEVILRACFK